MKSAAVVLNSDDLMLSGEIYMPDECNRTFPAVCLCHGIPAVPYDPNEKGGYPELALKFSQAGFVAMSFNFRGAGPSQGNIDMVGWTHDLMSALEFLKMLPEVDKNRVCLLGSSAGAAVCIYVAARESRIQAVATLACPAEFDFIARSSDGDAMVKRFREIGIIRDKDFPSSMDDWLDGFKKIDPIQYINQVSPCPILLLHGDQDETVSVEHAQRLYEKAGEPRELVIIPGAGHRLRLDERAINTAIGWLSKQMLK